MRSAYSLLLYLLAPLLLLRLYWQRGDRARIRERFGHAPAAAAGASTWVHAVSVGEVMAALPLIRALLERAPGSVLVTTTTDTGSARVRELLGETVRHCYAPYDLPHAVRRFLDLVRPERVVVMETELWPNLFHDLRSRGIPLVIANGRLSPRSFPRYRALGSAVAGVLENCTLIAAQSEADATRFRALGAPSARVVVMGNLKFDFEVPADLVGRGRVLRERLGSQRPVWIAASTHDGEEQLLVAAHRELLREIPDAVLLVVPRHPQRFDAVAHRLRESGLDVASRSRIGGGKEPVTAQVLLGDSMGEMAAYYAAADVAFVGGSLVAVGGHNVLEPAAHGLPVVFGPHMFNFETARELLVGCSAASEIADAAALTPTMLRLLRDPGLRQRMGNAGRAAVEANRGALRRLLDLLDALPA